MATGWHKIGKYKYYFRKKTGVLATDTWVGKYYVNKKGQRVKSSDSEPVISQKGNTYTCASPFPGNPFTKSHTGLLISKQPVPHS